MRENQDSNKVFTLSVADVRGQKTNISYPNVKEIRNEDELKEALKFDHVAGRLKNNHRSDKDFISCNALIMDCDNDEFEKERIKKGDPLRENSNEWIMPEDLAKRFNGICFYICYSKSHNKMKDDFSPRPRFHIYFPLKTEITEAKEVKLLKEIILRLCPELDDGAKDATRFIFGVENPDVRFFDGEKCIDEILQAEETFTAEKENDIKSDVIVEGSRNSTLYNDGVGIFYHNLPEKAEKLFTKKILRCVPPLPDDEIARIHANVLKADCVRMRMYANELMLKAKNSNEIAHLFDTFIKAVNYGTEEQKIDAWKIAIELADKNQRQHDKKAKEEAKEKAENAEAEFLEGKIYFSRGTPKHEEIYEYNNELGYWTQKNFGDLRHDIRKHFKKNIDDFTKNKIATHIYEDNKILDDVVLKWNRVEKWNFANGTLNLETGELENHNPKNVFNLVMPYDYDEKADCPKFKNFIKDFCSNEPSRIATLEDFLGYILCADTAEQKMLFMYGSGGNGKTTLARVLKYVLGGINEKNVSSVPIADMNKQTERSDFEQARLNICPDNEYYITGEQCASLKRLTGNDTIRANRKFKDTKEFSVYTKQIHGFNDVPVLADFQEGMVDRLVLMKLETNFRRSANLNKNLEKELNAERVGIFNYIYECYKALKANGGIRTCCDQAELLQKTKVKNNLVAMWYDEERENLCGKSFPRTQAYTAFQEWCKELNLKKIYGRNTFYEKMRDFLTSSIGYEEHKENGDFFIFAKPEAEAVELEQVKTDEPKQQEIFEPEAVEAEKVNFLEDERTKKLMELVNYRLSFDRLDFYRELKRVQGNYFKMYEFLQEMQAKQGDKWKQGEYQIVIDEINKFEKEHFTA